MGVVGLQLGGKGMRYEKVIFDCTHLLIGM